jgi:hypothetical protein
VHCAYFLKTAVSDRGSVSLVFWCPYFESRFPTVDFQKSEMPIDLLGVGTDHRQGGFQLPAPKKSIGPSKVNMESNTHAIIIICKTQNVDFPHGLFPIFSNDFQHLAVCSTQDKLVDSKNRSTLRASAGALTQLQQVEASNRVPNIHDDCVARARTLWRHGVRRQQCVAQRGARGSTAGAGPPLVHAFPMGYSRGPRPTLNP